MFSESIVHIRCRPLRQTGDFGKSPDVHYEALIITSNNVGHISQRVDGVTFYQVTSEQLKTCVPTTRQEPALSRQPGGERASGALESWLSNESAFGLLTRTDRPIIKHIGIAESNVEARWWTQCNGRLSWRFRRTVRVVNCYCLLFRLSSCNY